MPRFLSAALHLPFFGRARRCTPSKPAPAPTCRSIEPTHSDSRLHSPISILNDDILLNIFFLYGHDSYIGEGFIRDHVDPRTYGVCHWHYHWWYKLVHVSRRWRCIIFASPLKLDLHLICTPGTPVADMLAQSPPLPLIVFYSNEFRKVTTEDVEGIRLALSHRDRVRRISLWISPSHLEGLISAMDGEFPTLKSLSIESRTKEYRRPILVLPRNFQGPKLRQIHLDGGVEVTHPMQFPLLRVGSTSIGGLVYLRLGFISQSCYYPPNDIQTQLSFMPQLRIFAIMFEPECPGQNVIGSPPITVRWT